MATLAGTAFEGAAAAAAGVPNAAVKLGYGTAGFRSHAKHLDAVFLRMGMLAALRSVQLRQVRPRAWVARRLQPPLNRPKPRARTGDRAAAR